ncbi:MAG TPA: peptidase S8, partial [Nitrosarchaeum sp.]|nr:peptidase S8 [Nitrosarchaeum sp.]
TVNVPVSFVIKKEIDKKDSFVLIDGKQSTDAIFGNGYVKGAFDMANRYMAGDWRQYYFDVQDNSINSAAIEMSWKTDDTNLSVFVVDPKGRIIQTNMPSGVFGHFLGWPSLDWLGNSVFSQGGGFFPVKNRDNTSTVLYVPINQTGTYTLLAHSTLFGGNSTTEPIILAAKFSNISSKIVDQLNKTEIISNNMTNTILQNDLSNPTIHNDSLIQDNLNESKTVTSSDSKTMTSSDSTIISSNDSFQIGLIVGLGIGTAIGIVLFLILRQKSEK